MSHFWRVLVLIVAFSILGASFYITYDKYNRDTTKQENSVGEELQKKETPTPQPKEEAVVSWYDKSACVGRYGIDCFTANGEFFNEDALTFAHRFMEFGTRVRFCGADEKCVVCICNDRGPFVDGRDFDLSYGCADELDIIRKGVSKVTWQGLNTK